MPGQGTPRGATRVRGDTVSTPTSDAPLGVSPSVSRGSAPGCGDGTSETWRHTASINHRRYHHFLTAGFGGCMEWTLALVYEVGLLVVQLATFSAHIREPWVRFPHRTQMVTWMMQSALLLHRVTLLLVALVTQGGCWQPAATSLVVRCEVHQRYASTTVLTILTNTRPRPQHLLLNAILPKDAYVSSLTIETGGRNYTTEVKERGRGGRRGPLNPRPHRESNTEETQRFRAGTRVEAHHTATFYLTYEQLLVRLHGHYALTIYLPPHTEGAEHEVQVVLRETQPITHFHLQHLPQPHQHHQPYVQEELVSPHEVRVSYLRSNGQRNTTGLSSNVTISTDSSSSNSSSASDGPHSQGDVLAITYDVERTPDGGEFQVLGRHFVHHFCPEGLPKLPTHTVFVLDVSGSMQDFDKLTQLKVAMEAILRGLPPEDSFEVLVFSTRVTSLGVYQAARPREVERGVAKIHRLQALGGTNFNDALLQAVTGANLHNASHDTVKQVVFLTDGKPNLGETRSDQLRRNVREANLHQLPIFSLALGQDADLRLLRQVSADNQGFTRMIDEKERPAQQLQDFYKQISTPLMTDVDIVYPEDEVDPNSVVRHGHSTYYSGDEVVVAGQLAEEATEVHPIVAGHSKTGPVQFRVSRISTPEPPSMRNNYVERLWAYLAVQDLLAVQDFIDDRNLREEMRARAKEIAIRFKFVTKLTTLEVVDAEEAQDGAHPGLKSAASRHQKSNTGGAIASHIHEELSLLPESEFFKTLPEPLSSRLRTSASSQEFSFSDNDPHFVVQVPGLDLPLCFDLHGSPGNVLNLVLDPESGILVNGLVTAAVGRAGATYFTKIFISLGTVNFTVTPTHITVDCLDDAGDPTVDRVSTTLWPFKKRNHRGGSGRRVKKPRGRRKSARRRAGGRRKRSERPQHRRHARSSSPSTTRALKPQQRHDKRHCHGNITRARYRRHVGNVVHPQSFTRLPQNWSAPDLARPHTASTRLHPHHSLKHDHTQAYTVHSQSPLSVASHIHQLALKTLTGTQEDANPSPAAGVALLTRPTRDSTHASHLDHHHPQAATLIHPQSRIKLLPYFLDRAAQNSGENTQPRPGDSSHDTRMLYPVSEDRNAATLSTQTTEVPRSQERDSVNDGAPAHQKEEDLTGECSKTFSWKKAAGRRYGDVVMALRNHRKLDLLLGDVDANLLVTRTRNKLGQVFLGFYLENHRVLSPNTTGIIGQFAYKTVGTVESDPNTLNHAVKDKVRLAVVQPGPRHWYQVSEVNAFLSSRRSLLHKTHVTCLYIRQQGRGLVAGAPADYLRPCLTC
ncbi:inter-alpha-trypsin inhibitor heavy chain H3 isoform X2 [Procambarus clarkii]|uniref:inter-alpha-trypsin inhibitor heavy chain H3 isoform X2 n=1 Tax=Procambarus clarkii TaxID=6728 RepID=UPI00374232FE